MRSWPWPAANPWAPRSALATRPSRPRIWTPSTSPDGTWPCSPSAPRRPRSMRPRRRRSGCIVIDNSSLYRYDPDVPLIVPEVNADAIYGYSKKNIIANPNCSTAQMVVALKPLHDRARIKRVVVSTYQSVSGAGKEGMDELWDQTKSIYNPTDDKPAAQVHQADRLQRDPAYRRLPRGWIDQGRMEDGGRDQEDPRSQDQGHGHLRARAGLRRPFRSDQHRVRGSSWTRTRPATSCVKRPVSW